MAFGALLPPPPWGRIERGERRMIVGPDDSGERIGAEPPPGGVADAVGPRLGSRVRVPPRSRIPRSAGIDGGGVGRVAGGVPGAVGAAFGMPGGVASVFAEAGGSAWLSGEVSIECVGAATPEGTGFGV